MSVSPDKVERVRDWLQAAFPDAIIDVQWFFDRDVTVFYVRHGTPQKRPSLEISDEAFEDVPIATLLADLTGANVIATMRRDETLRRSYFRDRSIPEHERRYIRCDGRLYRIVRDREHNVRIYDQADRLLANSPSHITVLPVSVFARDESQWHGDIRSWRGDDQ